MSLPHITTTSLASGFVGQPYNQPIAVVGGVTPYKYASNNLPPGLKFQGNTIVGTPTQTGKTNVNIKVTDMANQTASTTAPLTIASKPVIAITFPTAIPGQQYKATPVASKGTPPYKNWQATGLPQGLACDPETGVISGITNDNEGTDQVTVTCQDSTP